MFIDESHLKGIKNCRRYVVPVIVNQLKNTYSLDINIHFTTYISQLSGTDGVLLPLCEAVTLLLFMSQFKKLFIVWVFSQMYLLLFVYILKWAFYFSLCCMISHNIVHISMLQTDVPLRTTITLPCLNAQIDTKYWQTNAIVTFCFVCLILTW